MKCVLYTRVSSKEQEREGFSIPAQQKLLTEYANKHDFQISQEFTDVETAKSSGRKEFGRMVEYLDTNRDVRCILVEKTDRLYRNFKDYVLLETLDLELHLVKENETISKDSRSHAKLIHGIKVVLSKNYIDNLSEEVKKGMREKAEQGKYPGKAPFGYRNDTTEKSVVPDEKYAPLVKRLFQLYSTGAHSLASLRDKVYEEGWRTAKGRKIAKSMVEMVLKNRFYLGEFTWNRTRYRGQHVPLISKSLFESVHVVLTSTPRRQSGRREFLFKGILKCGHCECAIVGELKKGKYVYYHCTQARGPCDHPWIREEVLDQHMMDVLKAIEIDADTVGEIVRALKDSHRDEMNYRDTELLRLRKRDRELRARLDKAYEDRLDGVIDEAYWRRVSTSWRDEQDGVSGQIQKLSQTSRGYIDQAVEILELSKMAYSRYFERKTDEKRQLLQSLLSNCSSDGVTLCPTYKTPFNLVAEGRQNQLKLPQIDEFCNWLRHDQSAFWSVATSCTI